MENLEKDVSVLKTDVSVLKTDVSVLKVDVSVLKTDVKEIKERLGKVENDVSFLRDEVRIGFNTLNDTLNSMFDLTAKSIRANKKVAVIMENAYSEATEEYTKIKKSKK